jgi:GT2 family glycosyltransferase
VSERVSIVIPNWNGWRFLEPCLDSLRRQTYRDFRVFVVDNNSQDGSVERLRAQFPEVETIALNENRGFSAGVNAGIRASHGEFVVALNNDTVADPSWLDILIKAMDAHPEMGFGASMLLSYREPDVIDSIGDGYSRTGLGFKIGVHRRNLGQYRDPFEVFGACAAASIYRRVVLDEVGLFDEDFFAYMEDIDLSIRARMAGHRCLAVPGAIVYHIGSASNGGDTSPFSISMTAKNILFILFKNIPAPLLLQMAPLAFAAQAALVFMCLTTNKYPGLRRNLRAYGKGLLAGFRGAALMLGKRRDVQRSRRISSSELSKLIALSETQRKELEPARLSWRA